VGAAGRVTLHLLDHGGAGRPAPYPTPLGSFRQQLASARAGTTGDEVAALYGHGRSSTALTVRS
jgi:hypothetical protein